MGKEEERNMGRSEIQTRRDDSLLPLPETHLVQSRIELDPRSQPSDDLVVVSLLGEVAEVL